MKKAGMYLPILLVSYQQNASLCSETTSHFLPMHAGLLHRKSFALFKLNQTCQAFLGGWGWGWGCGCGGRGLGKGIDSRKRRPANNVFKLSKYSHPQKKNPNFFF
jgi:hypothetical protein